MIGRTAGGRILLPAPAAAERTHAPGKVIVLALSMLMFGQIFHYMIDAGPLYYLSKAWPVLTLPLTLVAVTRLSLPYRVLYAVLLAYVLGVTPLLSMIHLQNGLLDALATTAKTMPFAYYFAVSGWLFYQRADRALLTAVLNGLGWATFGAMLLLWLVVPRDHYSGDPEVSKLFLYDFERGYRIFMPMMFGVLLLFSLAHRWTRRREWWLIAAILAGFALMLWIFKQRTTIAAAAVVVLWIWWRASPGWFKGLTIAAVAVGALIVLILAFGPLTSFFDRQLGGSLTIRQSSSVLAWSFIEHHPSVLAFGAGSITRLSATTLSTLLGDARFYLADIGWLGVMFEYGMVGAALILGAYLVSWVRLSGEQRRRTEQTVTELALADYGLFALISTLIYSAVYTPGEIATVLALRVYYAASGETRDNV